MFRIRPAQARGSASLGWLDSRHSFSFGQYYDPEHMGFGALRVINEDRVQPGRGFGAHGHQDMEILSYVVQGQLEHEDSMGNGSIIRPGDVQRMSAGTGVRHSEFNPSATEPVHFLQIWIIPEADGIAPGYEQANFPPEHCAGAWKLVGSRDGRNGSVTIHQDIEVYATLLEEAETITHELGRNRQGWLQVVQGTLQLNDHRLHPGDGVAMDGPLSLNVTATSACEALLFDMTDSSNGRQP